MASCKITIVAENTVSKSELLAEHGLSMLIEMGSKRVLFDTGQGYVLPHNSSVLGVPWDSLSAIVLSHGHYDHTGGVPYALAMTKRPPLFAHPQALTPKYKRNANGSSRYIGISDTAKEDIQSKAEWVSVEEPTEIAEGLWLTGPIPRETKYEDTGGAFFTDEQCSERDELVDDQAAFLMTKRGTVIVSGCAHAGIVNTMRYVRQLTNNEPIHTVLGGMHLVTANAERIKETAREFQTAGVHRLGPCHCTGFPAMAQLWLAFPKHYVSCPVGATVDIDV